MIQGYVIQNVQGHYLAKRLFWYDHDDHKDVYVHPVADIEVIKKKFSDAKLQMLPGQIWFPPKTMKSATWSPEEGVKIVGKVKSFPWDY
jgi:hypothetical protein